MIVRNGVAVVSGALCIPTRHPRARTHATATTSANDFMIRCTSICPVGRLKTQTSDGSHADHLMPLKQMLKEYPSVNRSLSSIFTLVNTTAHR